MGFSSKVLRAVVAKPASIASASNAGVDCPKVFTIEERIPRHDSRWRVGQSATQLPSRQKMHAMRPPRNHDHAVQRRRDRRCCDCRAVMERTGSRPPPRAMAYGEPNTKVSTQRPRHWRMLLMVCVIKTESALSVPKWKDRQVVGTLWGPSLGASDRRPGLIPPV